MEKMLLKLAQQLDALDEASLLNLWNKYANLTSRFEPTKRWEENALIFSLIQAKHWKNQLFNFSFSHMSKPHGEATPNEPFDFNFTLERKKSPPKEEPSRCRILPFAKPKEE
ncbi:MAG: hypothetical protein IK079_05740 [Desulfovibrio sp.]|nr:hypothetical protein [Desulfovibrio sp.]